MVVELQRLLQQLARDAAVVARETGHAGARLQQQFFHRLDDRSEIMIPLSWRLGAKGHVSQIRLFYAQAGAASHYLLRAENGRHREALLKTIEDWSLGKHRSIERAYGLKPEELGRRIVTFAKQTVQGR